MRRNAGQGPVTWWGLGLVLTLDVAALVASLRRLLSRAYRRVVLMGGGSFQTRIQIETHPLVCLWT